MDQSIDQWLFYSSVFRFNLPILNFNKYYRKICVKKQNGIQNFKRKSQFPKIVELSWLLTVRNMATEGKIHVGKHTCMSLKVSPHNMQSQIEHCTVNLCTRHFDLENICSIF